MVTLRTAGTAVVQVLSGFSSCSRPSRRAHQGQRKTSANPKHSLAQGLASAERCRRPDDLLARSDLSFVALSRSGNKFSARTLVHCAGCEQMTPPRCPHEKMASRAPQSAPTPSLEMTTRSAQPYRLARVCAARAAATDAVTRARFLQEEQEWTARAREAEQVAREQHGPFTAP